VVRNLPAFENENLIVGTDSFSDAGVFRLRDDLFIVQSVDFFPPLVDDPFVFGQIAAANSISDVYAMGARPVTALNIVGFPDNELDADVLNAILRGGAERVQAAGAVVVGGHSVRDTEIKYGLSVTGVVEPEKLMTNSAAQPGDRLVLTKPLGTGFVTTAFKAGRCPPDVLAGAIESMVQLNVLGRDAALATGASATTDVTGFGLAGHAREMADASGVTLRIEIGALPLLPGAEKLLAGGNQTRASATNRSFAESSMKAEAGVDAQRAEFAFDAQTSGGLLISVPAEAAEALVDHARAAGATSTTVIGAVCERADAAIILGA
jgi:selenide,water dikinase